MADNQAIPPASGTVAADEVTYSGDTAKVQLVRMVGATGSEGAKTVTEMGVVTDSGSLVSASQSVALTLAGQANTTFQLTGTWSATVVFEASNDNTNWSAIYAYKAGDAQISQAVTGSAGNDIYRCTTSGFNYVRLRCSTYTSGTVVVTASASPNTSGVFMNFPNQPGAGLAVAHGAAPSTVTAGLRTDILANRAGIPFSIGGHPNLQSSEYISTGAITDDNILPAISAGTIYVITGITVTASAANTVNPSVRIGFGTANVPAQGATNADAVAKVVLSHPGLAPGSGIVKGHGGGIVGIGGDGEELRITCSAPTSGSLVVQTDWYSIAS